MKEIVLQVDALVKHFGAVEALKGLNLRVRRGEVYGFLGRNGAGKTTSIRIIMGISQPSAGVIQLFGEPLHQNNIKLRQKIGYIAQEHNFYNWMSPQQLGRFLRDFYPTWDDTYYQSLIERFGLPKKQQLQTFSGGMKAKLALASTLAHRPPLLLLDEPTAGMDPVARREFLEIIRGLSEEGDKTIFFSSHLIDEVELIADRVGIIQEGEMLYEGELDELVAQTRCYTCELSHPEAETPPLAPFWEREPAHLTLLQDIRRRGQRTLILRAEDGALWDQLSLEPPWRLTSLPLEEIFIAMVSDQTLLDEEASKGNTTKLTKKSAPQREATPIQETPQETPQTPTPGTSNHDLTPALTETQEPSLSEEPAPSAQVEEAALEISPHTPHRQFRWLPPTVDEAE